MDGLAAQSCFLCHFLVLLGEGYTVQKGQIPCKSLQVIFLRAAPPGSIEAPLSAAKLFHTHAPRPLSRSWQPGGGAPSQEGTSQHDKGGPTASDKRLGYLEGTWGTSAGTCDSCYRTVWYGGIRSQGSTVVDLRLIVPALLRDISSTQSTQYHPWACRSHMALAFRCHYIRYPPPPTFSLHLLLVIPNNPTAHFQFSRPETLPTTIE